MAPELRRTPINDVYELVNEPYVDARGSFLNVFRAQDESFIGSWSERSIAV